MDQPQPGAGRTLLEDLSLELLRVAAMIAEIAERDAERREASADPASAADAELCRVTAAIAARHARSALFGLDLNNPGWNLMLELYRARLEGRDPGAARLATDARLSMGSLARWRRRLIEGGWAERPAAAPPGRLVLTEPAADAMSDYFAALALGFEEFRFHRR
jgi:hypothetical protein